MHPLGIVQYMDGGKLEFLILNFKKNRAQPMRSAAPNEAYEKGIYLFLI
jgi:hypothetical protein